MNFLKLILPFVLASAILAACTNDDKDKEVNDEPAKVEQPSDVIQDDQPTDSEVTEDVTELPNAKEEAAKWNELLVYDLKDRFMIDADEITLDSERSTDEVSVFMYSFPKSQLSTKLFWTVDNETKELKQVQTESYEKSGADRIEIANAMELLLQYVDEDISYEDAQQALSDLPFASNDNMDKTFELKGNQFRFHVDLDSGLNELIFMK